MYKIQFFRNSDNRLPCNWLKGTCFHDDILLLVKIFYLIVALIRVGSN